jgi:hypothetical protein
MLVFLPIAKSVLSPAPPSSRTCKGVASELAKQKFDEWGEELRAKAQSPLEEQKEKIRSQPQEQLKGLLGK